MTDLFSISPILASAGLGLLLMALDLLSGQGKKGFLGWVAAAGFACIAGLAFMAWKGDPTLERPFLANVMVVDQWSLFFGVLVLFAGAATALLSVDYLPEHDSEGGEPYVLLAFSVTGALLLLVATDMIVLFLGLEIMSLALYVMAAGKRSSAFSMEAGLKYFVLGGVASAFLLFGMAFLYGTTGSLNLVEAGGILAVQGGEDGLAKVAMVLLITALAFKVAAVPFHWWTPDVYEGAPTPVTTFMAGAVKAAGFAVLGRLLLTVFGADGFAGSPLSMETVILVLAIATLVVGNLLGIVQDNVKRILAYSSIAHAGYVLLGIYAARTIDGAVSLPSAVPFYLLTYVIATVGAFGVIALLGARGEEDMSLDHLAGLGKRHPVLAVVLTLCVLSLAGVPPLVGFMGKLRLFQQLLEADGANLIWVVVAILASVVSLYYYLRILLATWFREPEGERAQAIAGAPGHLVLGIVAVLVLVLGVFPGVALDASSEAAKRVVPAMDVRVVAHDCGPSDVVAGRHEHPGLPETQQPSCGARVDRRMLVGTPMDPARKDLYRIIRNEATQAEPAQ